MATSVKGISSAKLSRDLGITQKSAWHLAQRIRQGFRDGTVMKRGPVEVDETYVGGKERNKHAHKRLRAGRGAVGSDLSFTRTEETFPPLTSTRRR